MSEKRVEKFEQLIAWQKARLLTQAIYRVTQKACFSRDFDLSRQLRRAAISIMANVAEGFERGGGAEFHQFLSVAKASCAELRAQLYIAKDVGYLKDEEFHDVHSAAEEVGKISGGLRAAVAGQRGRQ